MSKDIQRQLIEDLVVESLEGLDAFDAEMLALEQRQGDAREHLHLAFRLIHTIKGSSGCLGLESVEKVAHAGENLLSLMRDGVMAVSQPVVTGLLRCSDSLRDMMHGLETGNTPAHSSYRDLLQLLDGLQRANQPEATAGWGLFADEEPPPQQAVVRVETESVSQGGEVPPVNLPGAPAQSRVSDAVIRVDVAQIDRLMNLVGELVLARNQMLQLAGERKDPLLTGPVQRVNLITTELQTSVMKTRMQTVQTIWSKFPRLVRDLANEQGKQVALSLEGQETELDRTVIEAIKDPLTHLVRNAIDHGLEDIAERRRGGKSETGRLRLSAFHESGQVVLEISDDGRGMDPARIARKAIERGLITGEDAARMSSREIVNLIFLPGFSTAERVTNLSGRGVGMDVVRTNVEKIGGAVEVSSKPGEGTTMQIRIPLTLAIVPALLVSCEGARFAIPQASLLELVRLEEAHASRRIEYVDQAPVLRLRGKLLALLDLGVQLGLRDTQRLERAFVVVVESAGCKMGLVVDAVLDTEEIVVKPLHRSMKSLGAYAGATILGDGQVALILDIAGLARRAGIKPERRLATAEAASASAGGDGTARRLSLLMTRVAANRVAFPLAAVTRIEEIPSSRIEHTAQGEVLQYRGRIMPLIRIADCLGYPAPATSPEILRVVVCQLGGVPAGLLIDQIEDIFEETVSVERFGHVRFLAGSLVAGGQVADLLDLDQVADFVNLAGRNAA
jgi:two-component system chemotaxis sensor kinase CheA